MRYAVPLPLPLPLVKPLPIPVVTRRGVVAAPLAVPRTPP